MAKRNHVFAGLSMTAGELLEAALIGLERQRDSISEKMAVLRERLSIGVAGRVISVAHGAADGSAPVRKRRRMSAAARRRIAEAQRKRWAVLKQGSAAKASAASTSAKKKRRMSASGRARIIAATKKRWAAYHATKRAAAKKWLGR
jgi:hypothetical protein